MYDSIPIMITVKSQLPSRRGQITKIDANLKDNGSILIHEICKNFEIEFSDYMYLKLENGQILRGNDVFGQVIENKNRQRFEVALHTLELAKTRYYVSWAGILLGIAAIMIGSVLYSFKETKWQYGIVADGGSSHTSFILFNWPENYQTGIKQITECSVQEGGIDQFASYPEGVQNYLSECIKTLRTYLTNLGVEDLSTVRIYFGATAGMRLVNSTNRENASSIMNNIRQVLHESQFYFQSEDAKILSGQEEGAFSWISTNILANTLNDSDYADGTYGALDMGGASMQISYSCLSDLCTDEMSFDLFNHTYKVFSQSNLCYGLDEAMKRFVVNMIYEEFKKNGGKIKPDLANYCLIKEDHLLRDDWLVLFPATKMEIFNTPCTRDLKDVQFANAVGQLPDDFQFFHKRAGQNVTDCREAISFFTNFSSCTEIFDGGNCLEFDPDKKLMRDMPAYYAMSSYYWEFYRYMNTSSSNISFSSANDRIDEICGPDFLLEDGDEGFYNETDCFESSYIFDILTKGYKKFDETNFNTIFFSLDINGAEVSWALGFMIHQAAQMFPQSIITFEAFVVLLGFGILLTFISSAAMYNFHKRKLAFIKMTKKNEEIDPEEA